MAPKLANGKICYLEIPTNDIARSVGFYEAVFGWKTRRRGDGSTAFDDGVGEVSGAWVTGRPASQRMSLDSCLEEILLHMCEPLGDGVANPHTKRTLNFIQELKKKHGIDYDSHASYRFVEE